MQASSLSSEKLKPKSNLLKITLASSHVTKHWVSTYLHEICI